jgi:cytochrome b subunit of formate dehydrogenase
MWKWFAAVDRYCRWVLAVIMLLFIITGLGITKGLMDPRLAKQLHENILPIPFYILIVLHVFYSLPSQLVRWKVFESERAAGLYTLLLGSILLTLFFWLHFR